MDTSINNPTPSATKQPTKLTLPQEFLIAARGLTAKKVSVFDHRHNYVKLREWAIEQSKTYSRDQIDNLLKRASAPVTVNSRKAKKIINRKRNKIAQESRKRNR